MLLFQSGEILVVPFTDVGWSPYFPLISGLVTEMGGLVSHGMYSSLMIMLIVCNQMVMLVSLHKHTHTHIRAHTDTVI